ncbi:TPA: hypothetical protein PC598_001166 [Morganella morganii]|nr:hypothetical protein [Morganella morganii]
MKISSPGSISGHRINNKEYDYINNMNNNLLEIEKSLYCTNEPDNETKLKLNNLIFGFINEIENKLKSDHGLTDKLQKNLQILNIKFGMAAMKSGDTDWESFSLSKEVHDNSQLPDYFSLTLDELQTQKITAEERIYAWNCCQYNFAHNLIYTEMPAPENKMQEMFSFYFDQYKIQGISENIAIASANAKIAEKLCQNSFSTEEEELNSSLFIASRKLNQFYDDYIKCVNPETDMNLILEGEILSKYMSVFIPSEIKKLLKIS